MAIVVTKCPKCGGQLKLEEQWEEGFCIYCGNKVKNELAMIRYDESCNEEDEAVDTLFSKLCDKLSTENIRRCTDLQKIRNSVQYHLSDYGNRIRKSKNKYAKKMNDYCHAVGSLTYETSKKNWEELKSAVYQLSDGCAMCMAYGEFSGTFLKSVDKVSSVLSLRWERSKYRRNAPDIDPKELIDMRTRTEAVRKWIHRLNDDHQNALSTSIPESNNN